MKRSGLWNVDFRPRRHDWAVWLPTLLGVGVLLMMLGLTAHRLVSPPKDGIAVLPAPLTPFWQEPAAISPATDPPTTASATPGAPSAPATTSAAATPSGAVGATPGGAASSRPVGTPPPVAGRPQAGRPASGRPASGHPRTSRPVPPPVPASVTGRYRVVDSFGDGFIGEVLIRNAEDAPAGWVVALRFPANVGELRTSWVESAPQATLSRRGDTFVWRSGVPVGGGSSVALRFQFARQGAGDRPSSCTVDGAACA